MLNAIQSALAWLYEREPALLHPVLHNKTTALKSGRHPENTGEILIDCFEAFGYRVNPLDAPSHCRHLFLISTWSDQRRALRQNGVYPAMIEAFKALVINRNWDRDVVAANFKNRGYKFVPLPESIRAAAERQANPCYLSW